MTETAGVPRLPHRVTIVGGGFAGLYAAKSLCWRAGEMRKAGSPEAVMETTIAKHFSNE